MFPLFFLGLQFGHFAGFHTKFLHSHLVPPSTTVRFLKGKVILAHAVKAYKGSRGVVSSTLNLGARWK
jgi:hypothetical protein